MIVAVAWLGPLLSVPRRARPDLRRARRDAGHRPPAGHRARLPRRGRRGRGDAPQQPGLCGERAGDGRGSRRRHRRDRAAASPTSAPAAGVSSTCSRSSGCVVALDLARRLPETRRFDRRPHRRPDPTAADRTVDAWRCSAPSRFAGNIFVAPGEPLPEQLPRATSAGSPAGMIAVFTHRRRHPGVHRPDRRRADRRHPRPTTADRRHGAARHRGHRRRVRRGRRADVDPVAASAGCCSARRYPALAVYRTELFPTGNRSRATGLVTAAALIGGIVGLLLAWAHCSTPTGRMAAVIGDPRNRPVDRRRCSSSPPTPRPPTWNSRRSTPKMPRSISTIVDADPTDPRRSVGPDGPVAARLRQRPSRRRRRRRRSCRRRPSGRGGRRRSRRVRRVPASWRCQQRARRVNRTDPSCPR